MMFPKHKSQWTLTNNSPSTGNSSLLYSQLLPCSKIWMTYHCKNSWCHQLYWWYFSHQQREATLRNTAGVLLSGNTWVKAQAGKCVFLKTKYPFPSKMTVIFLAQHQPMFRKQSWFLRLLDYYFHCTPIEYILQPGNGDDLNNLNKLSS